MDKPIERVRAAIEAITGSGKPSTSGGWLLRCPAHSDRSPSLCLDANADEHALLYCQAGCDTDAVLTAAGLTRRDLYPADGTRRETDPVVATYRYTDEAGNLLYEVLRTAAKRFRQRRPDPNAAGGWVWNLQGVRRVLYRLPLVVDAVEQGLPVYVVEGEKDVHSIEATGRVATTNPGGVGKWRSDYTHALAGAHVLVVSDRDPQGQGLRHARAVVAALAPVAASVTLLQPKVGKDVTDHLVAGFELDELEFVGPEIADAAPQALPVDTKAIDDTSETDGEGAVERPSIRLRPASEVIMEPVRWVWADRMPVGEICLIPGREGIGKSIFLAWLAAQITRGLLPGIYHKQPRAVLYAAAEDSWKYTIAPRMHAAGADLSLIYRIDVVDAGLPTRLTLPQHCELLPAAAEQSKAAMLMCDPILSNLADHLNPNHGRELRQALEPLRHAAEQADIAVAGLAHFNKQAEGDILSKVSGSRAWSEVARSVIAIAREARETGDGDERPVQVVTQSKNNLGRVDLPSLEYDIDTYRFPLDRDDDATGTEEIETARLVWREGVSLTSADEILSRRHTPREGGRRANIEQVLGTLEDSGRAMSPRDVADTTGLARNTVKQILNRLAATGQIDRVGTGLYKAKD